MRYIVKDYLKCTRCPLSNFRRNIVFGRGKVPAKILFVGEAPGKTEDLTGLPFVGRSGKLLDSVILFAVKLAGITEAPTYFITNVCACRPCDSSGGENREPNGNEAWACWSRLEKTYTDIKPQRVVLLGKVAQKYTLKAFPNALCLPHPAYVLRLGGQDSPLFRAMARDLSQLFLEVK